MLALDVGGGSKIWLNHDDDGLQLELHLLPLLLLRACAGERMNESRR